MAIDTEDKRRSALGTPGFPRVLPVPDTAVEPIDQPPVIGYFARNYSNIVASWENGTVLKVAERGDELTTAALPPGDWVVMIKALDTSGNYSDDAAFFNITVSNTLDIVVKKTEHPRWVGTKTDCIVHDVSGTLVPVDNAPASGNDQLIFDNFALDPVDQFTYEAAELDIGYDATFVRVWAVSQVYNGAGNFITPQAELQIDYRSSSGTYDGFEPWTIGRLSNVEFVKQRMIVYQNPGALGVLAAFEPTIDVERRTQVGTQTVPPGGVFVAFPQRFANTPIVTATVVGSTALIPLVTGTTPSGFFINVLQPGGTDVGGVINWSASGA